MASPDIFAGFVTLIALLPDLSQPFVVLLAKAIAFSAAGWVVGWLIYVIAFKWLMKRSNADSKNKPSF